MKHILIITMFVLFAFVCAAIAKPASSDQVADWIQRLNGKSITITQGGDFIEVGEKYTLRNEEISLFIRATGTDNKKQFVMAYELPCKRRGNVYEVEYQEFVLKFEVVE